MHSGVKMETHHICPVRTILLFPWHKRLKSRIKWVDKPKSLTWQQNPCAESSQSHGNCNRKMTIRQTAKEKKHTQVWLKVLSSYEIGEMYNLPVTPLVVIPRDKLNKVVIQSNSSLGIKNAWPVKTQQNISSNCIIRVTAYIKLSRKSTL